MVSLSISMAWQANAQNTAAQDSLNTIALSEVTLSVTRFANNSNSLAQQALIVNKQKIAFYNQQTTAELLAHTGAVFVQKSQLGGGSPVLRGFEANKVLITVDGIRQNNAVFRGGHLQNVITIDNSIMERAEILFGPSSVLYGSDALGGVLSFYTKDPVLSSSGKTKLDATAYARYATAYDEGTVHADMNVGGKRLASLSSFTISDFGDLRAGKNRDAAYPGWGLRPTYVERINGVDSQITNKHPEKQVNTGYTQYDFLQKLLFKTGAITHILNFQYSTSSDVPRYDRLTLADNAGVLKSAEWYYGPQKRLLAAWHMKLPASAIYDKATITPSYQDIEESRNNRNYRSTKLNHRIEKIKVAILNADFSKQLKKVQLGYGAELTYNKVNSTAFVENIQTGVRGSLDTRYPDGGSNTQSYALYSNAIVKASDKLTFNAGLRFSTFRLYSKFKDKTFFPFPYDDIEQTSQALSGNVGLVILPGSDWKLSALISTGFRTPNVDDIAKVFESGTGTLIVPNPNLKPEKTLNYELGIAKEITGKALFSITGWYTNYQNILTTDFSTFNGSPTILYNGTISNITTVVNKAKAFATGISGDARVNLPGHFSAQSMITYTYGRIKESPKDYPLDHIVPLYGKTSLMAQFGMFTGEAFAIYQGAKKSADYNLRGEDNQASSADPIHGYTPAWLTANLRGAYHFSHHLTVQFAVENIFDKFYRVFSSGLSAPGRNFVFTLRTKL